MVGAIAGGIGGAALMASKRLPGKQAMAENEDEEKIPPAAASHLVLRAS